jgi:hypothetical protein
MVTGRRFARRGSSEAGRSTRMRTATPIGYSRPSLRAISSAGERFVHTEEVTGSIPVSPTIFSSGHRTSPRSLEAPSISVDPFGQEGLVRVLQGMGKHRSDSRASVRRTAPMMSRSARLTNRVTTSSGPYRARISLSRSMTSKSCPSGPVVISQYQSAPAVTDRYKGGNAKVEAARAQEPGWPGSHERSPPDLWACPH